MKPSALVTVAAFSFPHEAQLARANLESAGIPAFVADEHTINMQWMYSNALGGVKVQVPRAYAEEAQALLKADFSANVVETPPAPEPPRCPACSSTHCEVGSRGKVPAFLALFLLGLPWWFTPVGIQCHDCGLFTKVRGLDPTRTPRTPS